MLTAAAAVLAASLVLVGCGSSDSSDSSDSSSTDTSSDSATTSPEDLDWAKSVVTELFAGTDRALPTDGPKAVPGKTVWALACSTTAPGCDLPAESFVEAAAHLGWTTKLVDGKLDPSVYNTQIRAAAAAGADAIALFAVDCPSVEGAVKAVQAQGTKVFGVNSLDCDDKYSSGGKPLFDATMVWGADNQSYADYVDSQVGPSVAAWVIDKTEGKANIIQLRQDDSAGTHHIGESEYDTLKSKCGGCTVNVVDYTGADLTSGGVQSKLSAALQRYPDADVVMVPVDAAIALGAGAAVQQARATGRDILLVGQEGVPSSIQLIKQGQQDFALGRPWPWVGWAAADALNRYFAGAKPVDAGFGFGSMDADHPPASDVYDGNPQSSGYQANYLKIWGVS